MPTVPAEVVVGPISVLLPIGIVVLAVVGNQVVQGKAARGNDESGAMLGLPAESTGFTCLLLPNTSSEDDCVM